MKSLLVPIEDHNRTPDLLKLAVVFGERFGSVIDGVALRLPRYQAVGAEPIVAVAMPPMEDDEREILSHARGRFEAFVHEQPGGGPRLRWRGGDPVDDHELGALGRVYDLTVIGRPATPNDGPRMTTLEAALFESGRPILIAPPKGVSEPVGDHVVISWNQSTEGAQTIAATLPVLHAAKKVTILTIEGAKVPGPTGDELRDYLEVHDIHATHVANTSNEGAARAGAAILDFTAQVGGDLLIKSAYTQSRLRQMIFGGATSHILAHAQVPVLMAN